MSQQPQQSVQKPSLGRVVLFQWFASEQSSSAPFVPGREYAADIVRVDEEAKVLVLHVKTTDPYRPLHVATVPLEPGQASTSGCLWRWPPRV